jgi:UDP-glucuronate 4-epimerase
LIDARVPRHLVYNLSSGVEWPHAIRDWCEVLRSEYPDFDYRLAENSEQPNIWYTDKDRYPMDAGRIAHDIGFAPRYGSREAHGDYCDWLRRTAEFFRA